MYREFLNNQLNSFQHERMSGEVYEMFRAVGKNIPFSELSYMNDATLLAYYAAGKISPSFKDGSIPDGDKVHEFITFGLFDTVFSPEAPEFTPEKTVVIIKRALFIARSNWMLVEDNPKQPWVRRAYAKLIIEDIDKRLEPKKPTPTPANRSKQVNILDAGF